MLVYVSRANAIVVLREKTTEGKPERTRVAIIKTPKLKVRKAARMLAARGPRLRCGKQPVSAGTETV